MQAVIVSSFYLTLKRVTSWRFRGVCPSPRPIPRKSQLSPNQATNQLANPSLQHVTWATTKITDHCKKSLRHVFGSSVSKIQLGLKPVRI